MVEFGTAETLLDVGGRVATFLDQRDDLRVVVETHREVFAVVHELHLHVRVGVCIQHGARLGRALKNVILLVKLRQFAQELLVVQRRLFFALRTHAGQLALGGLLLGQTLLSVRLGLGVVLVVNAVVQLRIVVQLVLPVRLLHFEPELQHFRTHNEPTHLAGTARGLPLASFRVEWRQHN